MDHVLGVGKLPPADAEQEAEPRLTNTPRAVERVHQAELAVVLAHGSKHSCDRLRATLAFCFSLRDDALLLPSSSSVVASCDAPKFENYHIR